MLIRKGIPASLGIAMGPVLMVKKDQIHVEKHIIPPGGEEAEIRRFNTAVAATREDLNAMHARVMTVLGRKHARIIESHNLILSDAVITHDIPVQIKKFHINAEYALQSALENIEKQFSRIDNEYFRERRFDFIDVFKQIMGKLSCEKKNPLENMEAPAVIAASSLFPSDTIAFRDNKKVLGFCTDLGSKASHTAIFAQSVGLPAVVGLVDFTSQMQNGDYIIIDGEQGTVILNPTAEIIESYRKRRAELQKEERFFQRLRGLPAITVDGHTVELFLNLDSEDSPFAWKSLKADGVGLYRTEGLFMNRTDLPSEEEQYKKYSALARAYSGLPVVVRTADIGGDRATRLGIKGLGDERNPFMGFRGIRLFLKYPELLKTQLRAVFRANTNGNLSVMVPMVASCCEVEAVRQIADVVVNELSREGKKHRKCRLGIMIEIPSAALTVDKLLDSADFVSIGTNDLVQYTLAVDRVNQYVSALYEPFHPAVLRLIHLVTESAHRKGKKVSICGEMASSPEAASFLAGTGVDALSATPKMYLRMKNAVRNLNFRTAATQAISVLDMPGAEQVREFYDRENRTIF